MAAHEVPFTQEDLLQLLTGDKPKGFLLGLFREAAYGKHKDVETVTGRELDDTQLCRIMAEPESHSFFQVPEYLYNAWVSATERPLFHGMRIKPWQREFIVVQYDMDEIKNSPAFR